MPWRTALGVFVVALLGFTIAVALFGDDSVTHTTVDSAGVERAEEDAAIYVWMAEHPGRPAVTPFTQRPLMPWLIAATGVEARTGYKAFTVVLLAGTTAAMFLLAASWVDERRALLAAVALAVSWPLLSLSENPFLTDPVALFSLTTGLLLLVRRRWWALAFLLGITVMARESALYVLLPAAGVAIADRKITAGMVAAFASPIAGFIAARALFYDATIPFGTSKRPTEILDWVTAQTGIGRALIGAIVCGLGVALVAAFIGWANAPRDARLCLLVAVPCGLSLLVASDWTRMVGFALPALLAVAVNAQVGRWGTIVVANATVSVAGLLGADTVLIGFAVMAIAGGVLVRSRDAGSPRPPVRPTRAPSKT